MLLFSLTPGGSLFPEFSDKKIVLTFKGCLRFLIFTNLFLPSKILLHNGIRERGEFYLFFLGRCSYAIWVVLCFLVDRTTIISLFWEYSSGFRLHFSKLFPINVDLNLVIDFYLGNPSSSFIRSGICFGTFALAGGGLCFQWARECANSTVAGDLFMDTSLAEIKASIKAHDLKLEQIEFDRIKNFEYYRSKDFSLEAAFSKAECLAIKVIAVSRGT